MFTIRVLSLYRFPCNGHHHYELTPIVDWGGGPKVHYKGSVTVILPIHRTVLYRTVRYVMVPVPYGTVRYGKESRKPYGTVPYGAIRYRYTRSHDYMSPAR